MADSTWVRREGREGGEEEGGREEGVLDASRLLRALVRRREMKRSSLFLFLVFAGGRRVEDEEEEGAWRCSRRVARTRATCSSVARTVRMSTVPSRE
jgi:hypothetical protein